MELKGESLLRELAGKVLPAAVEKINEHVYFSVILAAAMQS